MSKRFLWQICSACLFAAMLILVAVFLYATRNMEPFSRIGIAVVFLLLVAFLASIAVSRFITRPLEEMQKGTERLARGDFSVRFSLPAAGELGILADNMNAMAGELKKLIEELDRRRGELEAILSGMAEGILVLDRDQRIVRANRAALELMGIGDIDPVGRTMREAVPSPQVRELAGRVMASHEPVEADIILSGERERCVQARGALVRDNDDQPVIAIIMLNDVTRIRQLEEGRRDFVANVSHELKTPITSIKGFVETLQDGAANNPGDLHKFLGIIARQTERLESIINDILSLSRIEHDSERGLVDLEPGSIAVILKDTVEICADRAKKKNMKLALSCEDSLSGMVNAALLEQAVVNLIDNAVKYSGEGTTVEIEGRQDGENVLVVVRDEGPGIEKEHQSRVFERFYRVDKGRSRQLGGTGLGLSIVKHIAIVHGGSVEVQSEPGKGSAFIVRIQPVRDDSRLYV